MRAAILLAALVFTATATAHPGPPGHRHHTNVEIIRIVFGKYADQAVAVSRCETGGTFSLYASNGQYLGLFQMGSSERARYGHGWNAWAQARAAYRYFVASGRDWSPWSCKPW